MSGADPGTFAYTGGAVLEAMESAPRYNNSLLKLVSEQLPEVGAGTRVLDFGSGTGTYARLLRDATGVRPVCLEIDAEQRAITENEGFECVAALTDVSEPIGLIYSLNVLEHIDDDRGVADAIFDALQPGGRFIVYVPAFAMLYSRVDHSLGHVRRYRVGGLVDVLASAGFVIDQSGYADPLGFVVAAAFKVFRPRSEIVSAHSVALFDRFVFPPSQLLQPVTRRWVGKNAYAVARKPA